MDHSFITRLDKCFEGFFKMDLDGFLRRTSRIGLIQCTFEYPFNFSIVFLI